jgi:(R,R)-butanediol dehydrogenase/meso-butanediol dehydrogenase/diacetyl reductase
VGVPGVLQECINTAPIDGRIVVVGVCMHEDSIFPLKAIAKELQLIFVYYYRKQDFQFTLDMLGTERVEAHSMITSTVGFDAFPEAFEDLKQPSTQCKVLLEP